MVVLLKANEIGWGFPGFDTVKCGGSEGHVLLASEAIGEFLGGGIQGRGETLIGDKSIPKIPIETGNHPQNEKKG